MGIEWSEGLSVGVKDIDDQHKELIKAINSLIEAMSNGKGKEEIAKVIKFLEDYVVTHFGMEEKLMVKYGYEGYNAHKAAHEAFIQDFIDLKKSFETEASSSLSLMIQTNRRLRDWLINHIERVDKNLGSFLKNKQ